MVNDTITICRYEVGDVLDLKDVRSHLTTKRRMMSDAKRGIVWQVRRLKTGELSYVLILDTGNHVTLTPGDQGAERFIGHIDLGLLTGIEKNNKKEGTQNDDAD